MRNFDLFPECYITFDNARHTSHESDPMVKDVCAVYNNQRISYIDSYAKDFIAKYFTKNIVKMIWSRWNMTM